MIKIERARLPFVKAIGLAFILAVVALRFAFWLVWTPAEFLAECALALMKDDNAL